MRLTSGAPYWLMANGLAPWPIVTPLDCHVAVIGGGLAGAMAADTMALAGFTVTVIDRREPATGSTAANTGIVTYELDAELAKLAEMIGAPFAIRSYRAAASAIDTLDALIATLPDDCGFERCKSLYLARRTRDARRLVREAALRSDNDLAVSVLSAGEVRDAFGLVSHGALLTPRAAQVDPVRLTRALLARAQSTGATICPRTTALSWTADHHRVCIETTRGPLTADWLILAAGYEVPPGLRNDLVNLHSTYALITAPEEPTGVGCGPQESVVVWDTARPYTYMRSMRDGRTIIGGGDVPFRDADWRDRLMPSRARELERQLSDTWPAAARESEFAWSGTFGETRDGLPCIGPVPGMPRVLALLGYGGNGIVFSVIGARILRNIILNEGHEDAELFSLERDQAARRS